jgi:hypothetical protein
VGHVAPLEREMLHAADLDVVDERGASLNEPRILAALDALAHQLRQHGRGHHVLTVFFATLFAAARWIALTMC